MKNKDEFQTIVAIAERAESKNMLAGNRQTFLMDLTFTHEEFNLRLEELLNADDQNFAHDIIGIQNNMDRQNLKMANFFVPRYATQ